MRFDPNRLRPFILHALPVLSFDELQNLQMPDSAIWPLVFDGSPVVDWDALPQLLSLDAEELVLFNANFREGIGRTGLPAHLGWPVKRVQRVYQRVRRRIRTLRHAGISAECAVSHVRYAIDSSRTMELQRLYGGGLVWQLKHERE